MISVNLIFNFINVYVTVSFFFFNKILTLGILFSTAVRAVVVVPKSVILGILFLTSFILAVVVAKLVILGIILALRVVLVARLVISGVLFSILLILALYTSFLTTSFLLNHLVCLNQQEQVLIYQHLINLLYFPNYLN